MAICIGPSASAVYVAPTLTLNSSTNYNQNSGVLNATVTATGNKPITSVEFQWSTSATFASGNSAWTAASTNTLIPQGTASTARTVTATSLANNTTHYVRFRATNANGFVDTSSIGSSFKTYKLNTSTFTSSSTWTNPVPSSGTSGLAITSGTAKVWAGGAGGSLGGGGGGGYATATVSVGSSVSVTVGGGGAAAVPYSNGPGNGSSSSFGSTSATGGTAGQGDDGDFNVGANGGASGSGNAGGTGGGGTVGSGGGGGGLGGVGGNGNPNATYAGGTGGAADSTGRGGGGGGTGGTSASFPAYFVCASPSGSGAANSGRGGGGFDDPNQNIGSIATAGAGGSGYVSFEYWGP